MFQHGQMLGNSKLTALVMTNANSFKQALNLGTNLKHSSINGDLVPRPSIQNRPHQRKSTWKQKDPSRHSASEPGQTPLDSPLPISIQSPSICLLFERLLCFKPLLSSILWAMQCHPGQTSGCGMLQVGTRSKHEKLILHDNSTSWKPI